MLQSRLVKLAVMPMTRSLIAFLSLYMFPLHQASSFGFFWPAPISCSWKPGGPLAIPVLAEDSRLLPDFALSSPGVFFESGCGDSEERVWQEPSQKDVRV